jgi:hypothetical protein
MSDRSYAADSQHEVVVNQPQAEFSDESTKPKEEVGRIPLSLAVASENKAAPNPNIDLPEIGKVGCADIIIDYNANRM